MSEDQGTGWFVFNRETGEQRELSVDELYEVGQLIDLTVTPESRPEPGQEGR